MITNSPTLPDKTILAKHASPEDFSIERASLWKSLAKHLEGRYLRSVLLLVSGAATGQVVTLFSSLVLTRIYQPEQFGVLAIFVSVVAVVATISALRYEAAIPLPEKKLLAAELLVLSLGCLLAFVVCVGILLWSLGDWLLVSLRGEILQPYLWLLPFGILGVGIYQILTSWLVRQQNYSGLAQASIVQAFGQAGCQIGLGLLGLGSLGLIAGEVLGRASGGGALLFRSWRSVQACWWQLTLRGVRQTARRFWRFPAISSWAALLNTASVHSPLVLFAVFYDLEIVGCLALAQRILGAPTSLLSNSVSKVFLGECARLHNEAPQNLPRLFWKTVLSQAALGVGLVICVGLPAPWLFRFVFGEQWDLAGWCVLLLSANYLSKMIAYPLGASLDVLERQGLHMLRELLRLLLTSAAVLVAAEFELSPLAAVAALSAASCLAYGAGVCIVWVAIQRSLNDEGS